MVNNFIQITAIKEVNNNSRCIYFAFNKNFTYQAGQYITLLLNINGKEVRRPYSLSSFAQIDPTPFITVKLIENGEASRFLHEQLQVGDRIEILPANGRFTLPEVIPAHLFFLAAGSGISPILGLIKQALFTSTATITLVYSNRNKEQTIFYDELQALQQQFNNRFQIQWLFSNGKNLNRARLNRFLLEELVKQALGEVSDNVFFYMCGPYVYMEMIEITLRTKGFLDTQLFKETFSEPDDDDDDEGGLFDEEEKPTYVDATVAIELAGQTYVIEVNATQTILQAALAQNIPLLYSCRKGMCSTCTAQLKQGKVYMHYNQVLTEREEKEGRMLTCTSHPITSQLTISLDE